MKLNTTFRKLLLIAVAVIVAIGFTAYNKKSNTSQAKPAEHLLPVPFTTQAPRDNWEGNEACEEASAVMANAYLNGNHSRLLEAGEADKAINDLIAWEQANLGQAIDTGAADTAKMIEGVFHLKTKQLPNFTEDQIKEELLAGRVILLPINAQGLNHPNYKQGDVIYHMVVIRGYTDKGFVVHDPGTEQGRDNIYAYDKLFNPAADWDNTANKLAPDRKVALVVWK